MVHFAAGILPVTWHRGTCLFLVGKDVRDQCWSDFGGKCERVDKGDPLNTATREFYEETYGVLVDAHALRRRLAPGVNCLLLRSRTQNGHPYHMYVVEVPYLPHVRNAFHKALGFLRHKNLHKLFVEKTDVQWLTWPELRAAALIKRPVFACTVDHHAAMLERLASGADWRKLCAQSAGPPPPPPPTPPTPANYAAAVVSTTATP